MTAINDLLAFQRQTEALSSVAERLGWDQETVMPRGAVEQRAEEMAAIEAVLHERRTDPRIGEWLIDGCSVLPRDAGPQAVAAAAMALRAGLVATPPRFAAEALRFERVGERRAVPPGVGALTPREREVLVAMSHGLGNREIGGALGISAHTAKFHVAQIIAKLQAQSRGHAVAKALRAGLVDA